MTFLPDVHSRQPPCSRLPKPDRILITWRRVLRVHALTELVNSTCSTFPLLGPASTCRAMAIAVPSRQGGPFLFLHRAESDADTRPSLSGSFPNFLTVNKLWPTAMESSPLLCMHRNLHVRLHSFIAKTGSPPSLQPPLEGLWRLLKRSNQVRD